MQDFDFAVIGAGIAGVSVGCGFARGLCTVRVS